MSLIERVDRTRFVVVRAKCAWGDTQPTTAAPSGRVDRLYPLIYRIGKSARRHFILRTEGLLTVQFSAAIYLLASLRASNVTSACHEVSGDRLRDVRPTDFVSGDPSRVVRPGFTDFSCQMSRSFVTNSPTWRCLESGAWLLSINAVRSIEREERKDCNRNTSRYLGSNVALHRV